MKTHWLGLLLCVLLMACEPPSPPTTYYPLDAPGLTTKLGITDSDWQALQQLSSKEQGMVMFKVGTPEPNVIEIEFGNPNDHLHDQGGPIYRYEIENGIYKKSDTYVGVWNVHHSQSKK